jgi:hypothetical protein
MSGKIKMPKDRAESRRIINQLSVGERFMLMFGKGELKHDPIRVVPIKSKV